MLLNGPMNTGRASTTTRYPWLYAIGTVFVILGVIRLANGSPLGAVLLLVGVVAFATRLIQQSIEKSRRP